MLFNFYNEFYLKISEGSEKDAGYIANKFRHYRVSLDESDHGNKLIHIIYKECFSCNDLFYLGKEAAYDKDSFFILDKNGFKLKFDFEQIFYKNIIELESGFDQQFFADLLRSIVFIRLLLCGLVPVHSCSVEIDGNGVLFPAWGGVGKTRLLLNLTNDGAKFISDEWTLIKDQSLLPFRDELLMLDYDMAEYADRVGLSVLEKIKFLFSRKVRSKNLKMLLNYFKLILTHKRYDPGYVFPLQVREACLKKIYLLQSWDKKEACMVNIAGEELGAKLTLSFCRENRDFFYYYNMYKFAKSINLDILENIQEIYQQEIMKAIAGKHILQLNLPKNNIKGVRIREKI